MMSGLSFHVSSGLIIIMFISIVMRMFSQSDVRKLLSCFFFLVSVSEPPPHFSSSFQFFQGLVLFLRRKLAARFWLVSCFSVPHLMFWCSVTSSSLLPLNLMKLWRELVWACCRMWNWFQKIKRQIVDLKLTLNQQETLKKWWCRTRSREHQTSCRSVGSTVRGWKWREDVH